MTDPAVLFVCLGNICRSPLAEAALRHEAGLAGIPLLVDSAGTADYHVGEAPDPRAIRTAAKFGVDIRSYRGRQVAAADFRRFSHIFAADHSNLRNLERLAPVDRTAELALLLDLVPGRESQGLTDPWYGDEDGFLDTWADVTAAARGLLQTIVR